MRIAGVRLQASVARLLAELLDAEGFPDTAAKITDAIALQLTVEAPLTSGDYQAILEALGRTCPPTLRRLRDELFEEQRRTRRITGG